MIERYAASIPTMCSAGNHECTHDTSSCALTDLLHAGYDNRFGAYKGRCGAQMPVMDPNLVYYSFDYRNVHFISVDSVTMEAGDPNQISWLTSDLQVPR